MNLFSEAKKFAAECYKFTNQLPPEEKYAMASQIRRASLSVYLNLSEGCSRKSEAERKRYFEIARGSLIEIDAAFDIANALGYFNNFSTTVLNKTTIDCFKMITGLIKS
ncbi:four helix bundle protein [Ferruginibacter sp. HRS2-29]|uniref:four helix bundle protein n=1 Tax=Ferruginibacter sp. HRS2-29 TaxID=2487334 RepID=UPI0020CB850C|nr:four helix bundle protein [Ferruginibacter sp. HRS2-29]